MYKNVVPFIRQEGLAKTTIALITVTTAKKFNAVAYVVVRLTNAITEWVKSTEDGKRAWIYSGRDLNIGDLSSYENEAKSGGSMFRFLKKHGICKIEFILLPLNNEIVKESGKRHLQCVHCGRIGMHL